MTQHQHKSVLFVCFGNTCRSPMAEAIFSQALVERGARDQWRVDSAALCAWQEGWPPNPRTISTLQRHDVPISIHRAARLVRTSDFTEFDYIFGMDEYNISLLHDMAPSDATARVELLGKYDPETRRIIRDPMFYDGEQLFETCYQQCVLYCNAFLDSLDTVDFDALLDSLGTQST